MVGCHHPLTCPQRCIHRPAFIWPRVLFDGHLRSCHRNAMILEESPGGQPWWNSQSCSIVSRHWPSFMFNKHEPIMTRQNITMVVWSWIGNYVSAVLKHVLSITKNGSWHAFQKGCFRPQQGSCQQQLLQGAKWWQVLPTWADALQHPGLTNQCRILVHSNNQLVTSGETRNALAEFFRHQRRIMSAQEFCKARYLGVNDHRYLTKNDHWHIHAG